jgi:hypothetical protein
MSKKLITAQTRKQATAPAAMPAFAPTERFPDLDSLERFGPATDVRDADAPEMTLDVIPIDEGAVIEVKLAKALELAVGDRVVALGPPFVETMLPLPSSTIPRFWAQHKGSLSQQKLPSLQTLTRGKKPSVPPEGN